MKSVASPLDNLMLILFLNIFKKFKIKRTAGTTVQRHQEWQQRNNVANVEPAEMFSYNFLNL